MICLLLQVALILTSKQCVLYSVQYEIIVVDLPEYYTSIDSFNERPALRSHAVYAPSFLMTQVIGQEAFLCKYQMTFEEGQSRIVD